MFSNNFKRKQSDCEILLTFDHKDFGIFKKNKNLSWIKENIGLLPAFSCLFALILLISLIIIVPYIGILKKSANHTKEYGGKIERFMEVINASKYDIQQESNITKTIQNLSMITPIGGLLPPESNVNGNEELTETALDLKMKDPKVNSVGFLLPLRGVQRPVGFIFGQNLKKKLSELIEKNNSTSEILVRDTIGDPALAQDLTRHFYEFHGTRIFFGYVTDDEALRISAWGRRYTPGAKFISPTATSYLLEKSLNFVSVQPSSRYLAASVVDFLSDFQFTSNVIIVSQASISKDAFISAFEARHLDPVIKIYYHDWDDTSQVKQKLTAELTLCPQCIVMILGDRESWSIIEEIDISFATTWILPFPTQFEPHPQVHRSNVVSFQYQPDDYTPNQEFLKVNQSIDSITKASLHLILGGYKNWRGTYIVSVFLPKSSISNDVISLTGGWQPIFQYVLNEKGIIKKKFSQLTVNQNALNTLFSIGKREKCNLIIRYKEELCGHVRVYTPTNSSTDILVPVTQGAQIHFDCSHQHADIKCRELNDEFSCSGILHGYHHFRHECNNDEIKVQMKVSENCAFAFINGCRKDSNSFLCQLVKMCPQKPRPTGTVSCRGMVFRSMS